MIWEAIVAAVLGLGQLLASAGGALIGEESWEAFDAAVANFGIGLYAVFGHFVTDGARAALGAVILFGLSMVVLWAVLRFVKALRDWLP